MTTGEMITMEHYFDLLQNDCIHCMKKYVDQIVVQIDVTRLSGNKDQQGWEVTSQKGCRCNGAEREVGGYMSNLIHIIRNNDLLSMIFIKRKSEVLRQ